MYIYLLLLSGIFMGWSLGANDAGNVFGTAVATRVIKYRTAILLIAVFVMIGSLSGGDANIGKVRDLAIANGMSGGTAAQNGLFAAVILICAAITITIMTYLKYPVSTNQCITGALIGWGIKNAEAAQNALPKAGEFAATWVLSPVISIVICFILVKLTNFFLANHLQNQAFYDKVILLGYLAAGIYTSYAMGTNSVANVTALFVSTPEVPNLIDTPKAAAIIGGAAIAFGVLTYSKNVMHTVGEGITKLTKINGFLVVLATGLTIQVFSSKHIGINIPVSTSQALVGAIIGAGLTNGVKAVNVTILKRIFAAWFCTPFISAGMTYAVGCFIHI